MLSEDFFLKKEETTMKTVLSKSVVLVLNRHWQAVNTATPAEAFSSMLTGVATGLDVHGLIEWFRSSGWIRCICLFDSRMSGSERLMAS